MRDLKIRIHSPTIMIKSIIAKHVPTHYFTLGEDALTLVATYRLHGGLGRLSARARISGSCIFG